MIDDHLSSRRRNIPSTGSFSTLGEGNEVPYSGDTSFIIIEGSLGAGGGEEGVSKLVEDFE